MGVEVGLDCLRATLNVMRYDGIRRVSTIIDRVVAQGFTREQVEAALQRIAKEMQPEGR